MNTRGNITHQDKIKSFIIVKTLIEEYHSVVRVTSSGSNINFKLSGKVHAAFLLDTLKQCFPCGYFVLLFCKLNIFTDKFVTMVFSSGKQFSSLFEHSMVLFTTFILPKDS